MHNFFVFFINLITFSFTILSTSPPPHHFLLYFALFLFILDILLLFYFPLVQIFPSFSLFCLSYFASCLTPPNSSSPFVIFPFPSFLNPNSLSVLFTAVFYLCSFFILFVKNPSLFSHNPLIFFLHFPHLLLFDIHLLHLFILSGSHFLCVCAHVHFRPYSIYLPLWWCGALSVYEKERETDTRGGVGGSLKSFNEPVLTLMTGWVSEGVHVCVCAGHVWMYMWGFWGNL